VTWDSQEFAGTKRYAVRRLLGGGAMGLVYEAYDRERDVVVALKTLRNLGPKSVYRLKREFRSLADLHHENLVSLYELEGSDDGWFMTMELIEGENFIQYVRGSSRNTVANDDEWSLITNTFLSDVTDITEDVPAADERVPVLCADLSRLRGAFVQLLSGVAALHAANILHRDLKPSNLLATDEGRIVLLDFGLVYETDRNTSEQSRVEKPVGTAAFMPPEQARGETPGTASDMYSVGVLLFTALLGRLPHDGTMVQILQQKQKTVPPAPKELLDTVPADLSALAVALLRIDPAARPSAVEALALLGVADGALKEYKTGARTTPVEGREAQRQVLEDAWQLARRGRAVLVSVGGAPGMGKTALIRNFLRELKKREDVTTLSGRCYERESVPFKALDPIMDAAKRRIGRMSAEEKEQILPKQMPTLARLFPAFEPFVTEAARLAHPPEGDRVLAFEAATELFAAMCRAKPVILFIDDAQWGDTDSARLLAALLRTLRHAPLLVIMGYRTADLAASEFLTSFLHDPAVERTERYEVELKELSDEQALLVARGMLGDIHPEPLEAAQWVVQETGGNPFLMSELVKYLALKVEQGSTNLAAARLDALFAIDDLPRDARRLLIATALAGRPLPVKLIGKAADLDDPLPALTLLRARHYTRTNRGPLGDSVEVYHHRIGEAIQKTTPRSEQARVHLALADAMEGTGYYDPEAMMLHRLNGGQVERAADLAREAALQAERNLAFDRAARLYRTALSLKDWTAEEVDSLRQQLADALMGAGRGEDAAELLLELAEDSEPSEAYRLQAQAAQQLLSNGHLDEAMVLLDTVLARVGLRLAPSRRRAWISLAGERICLWWTGYNFVPRSASKVPEALLRKVDICSFVANSFLLIEPIQGAHFHSLDLLYAQKSGEPYRVARAMCREMMLITPKKESTWIALKRRTRALVEDVGRAHTNGLLSLGEGMHNYVLGKFKTAYRLLRSAQRTFADHCSGEVFEETVAEVFALRALMFQGELSKVSELLADAVAHASDKRNFLQLAWLRADIFSTLYLATEDLDALRADISWMSSRFAPRGWNGPLTYMHLFAHRANLQLLLYEGRNAEAFEEHERRFGHVRAHGFDRQTFTATYLYDMRARAALAAAPRDAAAKKVARLTIGKMKSFDLRWAQALTNMHEASYHRIEGDKPHAIELLRKTIPMFERSDFPLHAAVARRQLGLLVRGDEGRALVAGADGWMYHQKVVDPSLLANMLAPGIDKTKW
jgi:eukaryotic-like serine/threonine-protein kinase